MGNITSLYSLGPPHATQVFLWVLIQCYLHVARWGTAVRSWNKAMQRVHSTTITRQVSLLIFAIIYNRPIDS